MSLTKAQLAWCAAIFTAGTVTPPAIQKVQKRIAVKQPSNKKPAVQQAVRPPSPAPAPQPIMDCPMPSVPSFDGSLEYRTEPLWAAPQPPVFDAGGGVWAGGGSSAAIPEPDTWVMLISGFGLVGLSLRKKVVA